MQIKQIKNFLFFLHLLFRLSKNTTKNESPFTVTRFVDGSKFRRGHASVQNCLGVPILLNY